MSRSDIAFNAIALVLNGGWTLWARAWLVLHWTTMCLPWYVLALTIFVGRFVSDFFSGLLHWTSVIADRVCRSQRAGNG